MKKFFLSFLSVCLCARFVFAVSITVYNNDLALITDVREINLSKGEQKIEFDGVSSKIDPSSVLPKFLSDADKINIYEQNFDFDLVNTDKLLQQYIGSNIEIERKLPNSKKEKAEVKLLAVSGGLIVQEADKIILNPEGEISLPKLPEGLRLKPTLSWLVDSGVAGKKELELTYQTRGISWISNYVIILDKDETKFDINAWITLNNQSGATYKNAKLKLIAGDVNLVKQDERAGNSRIMMAKTAGFDSAESSFQEKSFFEYHMYELARKTTIKNNEKKQIEFISAQNIPINKKYTYNGSQINSFDFSAYSRTSKDLYQQSNSKVNIDLEFKNDKSSNLGIALPKGKIRVFKNDGSSTEFVGEDAIDHTPENETVHLNLGTAFDVTGERIRTNFKLSDKSSQETFDIKIKNSKDEAVEVEVVEPLYRWSNWEILASTEKFTKKDSKSIIFKLKVPAKSEKTMNYTVKYRW